ncbi:hypothetical protein GJ496_004290 [Pomphorhynchus laevis]|nr:hypothetical protein GJ496_004290 [Pomphorhynchus laevis]
MGAYLTQHFIKCQGLPSIIEDLRRKTNEEAFIYISKLIENVIELQKEVCERHRYLHPVISHFGRNITRCFPRADEPMFLNRVLDNDVKLLAMEEMIVYDLIRSGYSGVAVKILEKLPDVVRDTFSLMVNEHEVWDKITTLIRDNNIQSALDWIDEIRKNPEQYKIVLSVDGCKEWCEIDYLLNEALFVSLIAKGDRMKALEHARTTLCEIANKLNLEDKLGAAMTCLLFDPNVSNNYSSVDHHHPYNRYFSNDYRLSVCFELMKWLGEIRNAKKRHPLETCLTHGRMAIPAVLRMINVLKEMSTKTGVDFSSDKELPVALQIEDDEVPQTKGSGGDARREYVDGYHSRFVCPILKAQSTDENPPLRLRCGHVISKDALDRIVMNSRLKCPYCSSEQTPTDVTRVYF